MGQKSLRLREVKQLAQGHRAELGFEARSVCLQVWARFRLPSPGLRGGGGRVTYPSRGSEEAAVSSGGHRSPPLPASCLGDEDGPFRSWRWESQVSQTHSAPFSKNCLQPPNQLKLDFAAVCTFRIPQPGFPHPGSCSLHHQLTC